METLEKIRNHVVNLELDAIRRTVQEALDAGIPAIQILTEGLSKGVEIVGKKFEGEEYFLSELIMAGETMKAGVAVLDPHLKKEAVKSLGTIVLGTMKGDIHDIGKNIFGTLARSGGFNVVDLGVDVSADEFVETAKKNNADIIAPPCITFLACPRKVTRRKAPRGPSGPSCSIVLAPFRKLALSGEWRMRAQTVRNASPSDSVA